MLDEIASRLRAWAAERYRNNVPANARAYIKGVMGDQTPIDESFFSEQELEALRRAASRGWAEWSRGSSPPTHLPEDVFARLRSLVRPDPLQPVTGAEIQARNREIIDIANMFDLKDEDIRAVGGGASRPNIQYSHYDRAHYTNDGGRLTGVVDMLRDPSRSAATTVGRALIERTEDGSTILRDRYKFNSGDAELGGSLFARLDRLGERLIPPGRGFDVRVDLGHVPTDMTRTLEHRPMPDESVGSVVQSSKPMPYSPDIDLTKFSHDYLIGRE